MTYCGKHNVSLEARHCVAAASAETRLAPGRGHAAPYGEPGAISPLRGHSQHTSHPTDWGLSSTEDMSRVNPWTKTTRHLGSTARTHAECQSTCRPESRPGSGPCSRTSLCEVMRREHVTRWTERSSASYSTLTLHRRPGPDSVDVHRSLPGNPKPTSATGLLRALQGAGTKQQGLWPFPSKWHTVTPQHLWVPACRSLRRHMTCRSKGRPSVRS